ncbi:hypothetical protein OHA98_41515 [Streptomyces sp. NBC_00654]|uniref:hypothetical protein n=1 Tax=Streptomyces sp. NBC_00654 TaxID=2975799 RepID=UPI00225A9BBF|nr:hypothetical protein [Streptomyces sp. NBC_00654]MCX4971093.1 hypothetical protein [Streptomyces sp. NBC_00654]
MPGFGAAPPCHSYGYFPTGTRTGRPDPDVGGLEMTVRFTIWDQITGAAGLPATA